MSDSYIERRRSKSLRRARVHYGLANSEKRRSAISLSGFFYKKMLHELGMDCSVLNLFNLYRLITRLGNYPAQSSNSN